MILLNERQEIIHDEDYEVSESVRNALIKCNMVCVYEGDSILYRFYDDGNLFIASLSRPKFHTITLDQWDLARFRSEGRVVTKKAVVRDIGCDQSCIYMDDYSFTIPTELLLR